MKHPKQKMTTITAGLFFCLSIVISMASLFASSDANAQLNSIKNKVVFQVSDGDPAKWNLTLNNAQNVQAELGAESVAIEVVVYGSGIGMLRGDSPAAQRIAQALKTGVKVVACENTMKALKITTTDMLPNIEYVPAGVVELIQRQQQGYTYIRP